MALRKILTDSDPALHKVCRPVTNFDQRLWDLLDDLKETLADAGGAGLAAPQVGILRRCVIVVDAQDEMLELVNPEIIWRSEEIQDGWEGCLSVPGKWGTVPERGVVRGGGRGHRGPLLLPRAGPPGRPHFQRTHRPALHPEGAG